MNDTYRELKERMRRLDRILADRGARDLDFAQAVSKLHRAERRGDRSREPAPELLGLLERAEGFIRNVA
jgi:hypothetical protein